MSTACGRAVLMIGLPCATCLMSSETGRDPVEPPSLSHQEDELPSSALVGRWAASRAAELSPSLFGLTVVTITERPAVRSAALNQPLMPRGRDAIGRQLQKELKRVGCYTGELDGVWTTSTRQAMKAFLDRVNATLPIDEPDSILLTLVQGHPDKVCGVPCPAGQRLNRTSQCIPNAILAMAGRKKIAATTSKKSISTTSAWTVKTTLAGRAPPTEHPGDVAPVDAAPAAATLAPRSTQHRVAQKRWRPPSIRREPSWASVVFRFF
jgi:hypothetical protein